jgi:hypothetical protein
MGLGTSVGLRLMMEIQGIDRSTEAKGDTETEGYPETLATVGAAEFDGSWWCWGFGERSMELGFRGSDKNEEFSAIWISDSLSTVRI